LYDFVADQTNNFRDLDAEIIRAEHRFVKILRYLVKPRLDRIYAPIPPIPKPSDYISLPLRRVIVKTDGPEKYLPEEQDSTITNPDKYLLTGEIADMIAEIVGMETFSSGRYNSDRRANFT